MVYYNNPHITGFPLYTLNNQGFFIAQMAIPKWLLNGDYILSNYLLNEMILQVGRPLSSSQ